MRTLLVLASVFAVDRISTEPAHANQHSGTRLLPIDRSNPITLQGPLPLKELVGLEFSIVAPQKLPDGTMSFGYEYYYTKEIKAKDGTATKLKAVYRLIPGTLLTVINSKHIYFQAQAGSCWMAYKDGSMLHNSWMSIESDRPTATITSADPVPNKLRQKALKVGLKLSLAATALLVAILAIRKRMELSQLKKSMN